jgi:hypothetical protein
MKSLSFILLPAALTASALTLSCATSASVRVPQSQLIPQNYHLSPATNSQGAQLRTNRGSYARGQVVQMAFEVHDLTKKPIIYDFPTAQQFDVTVTDAQGNIVWDWAKQHVFASTLTALQLKPGQEKTYRLIWDGRDQQGHLVPPGSYTLNARMTSVNRPAITGNLVTDPDTDPQNMGVSTRTPAENGVIRQVFPDAPLTAVKTITIR